MGDTNYRRPNGAAENIGHNVAQQQAKGARTVVAVEPPADAAGASAAATAAICVLRDAVSSRRGAAWDRAVVTDDCMLAPRPARRTEGTRTGAIELTLLQRVDGAPIRDI